MDDDFTGLEALCPDLLPEGALPIHGLLGIEYVDADGVTQHDYQTLGECRVVEAIGLMAILTLKMWADAADEEDGED